MIISDERQICAAEKLIIKLKEKGMKIATAESCTGGLVSAVITSVPGSSDVFDGSVVSYANEIKQKIVGVSEENLRLYGAVSPQVASDMSEGIAGLMSADIGVGITGIAGPGGGSEEKPVGLVYISVHSGKGTEVKKCNFDGNRDEVRYRSVMTALEMALAAAE